MTTKWQVACGYADTENPEDDFWWEEIEAEDPQTVIDNFNDTLRPGERPKIIITTLLSGNQKSTKHDWYKKGLVTSMGKGNGACYDTYECRKCRAKGKRFGLNDRVTPNQKSQTYCKG